MKLSFECNQDIRKMPIVHGKKFCANCQKNVTDLRRKSDAKTAQFYDANPKACVIIYQDQLDKLPERTIHVNHSQARYFPYATGIIAISLLPTLTLAQAGSKPVLNIIGTVPFSLPPTDLKDNESVSEVTDSNTKQNYFIQGRVNIRDKKYKIKKGKDIIIYQTIKEADGSYRDDTLAVGKLGVNGNFKMALTKNGYAALLLDDEEVYFNIDGFSREIVEKVSYTKNTIRANISVSGRRYRIAGAMF